MMTLGFKGHIFGALSLAVALCACGDDGAVMDDGSVSTSTDSDTNNNSTTDPQTTSPQGSTGDPEGSTGDPGGSTGDPEGSTGDSSDGGSGMAMECMTDICVTYGAAVPAVSSQIVDEAAVDPMFMDDFAPLVAEGADAVDAFKESLTNFITDAYGCTEGAYTGPSMVDAHTGMGITQEEYDAFIGLIAGVLASNGVPDDDINYCFAPPLVDPEFTATIVGL